MWFKAVCPDCNKSFPVIYVANKRPKDGIARKRCPTCAEKTRVCVECGGLFTITNHRVGNNLVAGNRCPECRIDPYDAARLRDKDDCDFYEDCLWKCRGSRVCTDDCRKYTVAAVPRADQFMRYSSSLAME